MKYKAFMLDFYGTLVYQDEQISAVIRRRISETSVIRTTENEVGKHWTERYHELCAQSYGDNFKTRRELELQSIQEMITYFFSTETADYYAEEMFGYWQKPDIYADAFPFLRRCTLPIYIVSNIDRADINHAMYYHNIDVQNVITSEDVRAYKPRKEIFEAALDKLQLAPEEVLHVGDSWNSDIIGAMQCGMDTFWLNRKQKLLSSKGLATYIGDSLMDLLDFT